MVRQRIPFGQVGSVPVKSLSGIELRKNNSCSLQPLTGKLYTYFNSKVTRTFRPSWQKLTRFQYTFLFFLGLFELGSLLCGVANSSDMLIVGRAIAGMGGSGLANGALTIIAACAPLAKRPGRQSHRPCQDSS